MSKNLLTYGRSNPKTAKLAAELGFANAVLHLAPADLASPQSVCPWSTAGCRAACLNTAGRGQMLGTLTRENAIARSGIQRARIERTDAFWADRTAFVGRLAHEIARLEKYASALGLIPVVRLNGTSDLPWERFQLGMKRSLMHAFPEVQFYDYTKGEERAVKSAVGGKFWPANYHLTFSRHEESDDARIRELLAAGVSVAVVFADRLPESYLGHKVIDGTKHDFRFLDPAGSVVGLVALGRGKKDTSGFVVRL